MAILQILNGYRKVVSRLIYTELLEIPNNFELIEEMCYMEKSIGLFCSIELSEGLNNLNARKSIL